MTTIVANLFVMFLLGVAGILLAIIVLTTRNSRRKHTKRMQRLESVLERNQAIKPVPVKSETELWNMAVELWRLDRSDPRAGVWDMSYPQTSEEKEEVQAIVQELLAGNNPF